MLSLRSELEARLSALNGLDKEIKSGLLRKYIDLRRGDEVVVLRVTEEGRFEITVGHSEVANATVWLPNVSLKTMRRLADATLTKLGLNDADLVTFWCALTGVAKDELDHKEPAKPAPARPDLPPEARKYGPLVTVIGAGVSGLSAAHELIERGFRVQVVDDNKMNLEPWKADVGGIARTPLRRLPTREAKSGQTLPVETPLRIADGDFQGRLLVSGPSDGVPAFNVEAPTEAVLRVAFAGFLDAAAGSGDQTGEGYDKGSAYLMAQGGAEQRSATVPAWTVTVLGRVGDLDDPGGAQSRVNRSLDWVVGATEALQGWKRADPAYPIHIPMSRRILRREAGATEVPKAYTYTRAADANVPAAAVTVLFEPELRRADDPHDRGNAIGAWVELRVRQQLVPTEHGYRIFPSFYQHLFDTMRRTPLLDELGRANGQTTYDNLVPTGEVQMYLAREKDATKRGKLHTFPRTAVRSFEELRKILVEFKEMGYEDWDVALFEIRILKYLTSCAERRATEAEGTDWKTYIGIGDFRRSAGDDAFAQALEDAPLSLLAARADEVDARTQLNTTVQLLMDPVRGDRRSDQTLNGPTTTAFFQPWKRYLRYQGVNFYVGKAGSLAPSGKGDALRYKPAFESEPVPDPGATPFNENADYYVLATGLYHTFELVKEGTWVDDFKTMRAWHDDAVEEVKLAVAINRPDSGYDDDHYLSLGGVDKAGKNENWTPVGPFRTMAGIQYYFDSGVRVGGAGHVYYIGAPWGLSSISQPSYWRTRMQRHEAGFVSNLSVDLCNWTNPDIGGDNPLNAIAIGADRLQQEAWKQLTAPLPDFQKKGTTLPRWYAVDWHLERKDGDPSNRIQKNAAPFLINRPQDNEKRPTWATPLEAKDDGGNNAGQRYRVTAKQWVLAGPHMRTHTRLTSMEASNESARHAVNAILYDVAMRKTDQQDGELLGEFCKTWDPEDNEFPDLAPLKKLDERLIARGLPHMIEILGVEKMVIASPKTPMNWTTYLEEAYDTLRNEPKVGRNSWEDLRAGSERFMEWVKENYEARGGRK